jgi:hypothetical protein
MSEAVYRRQRKPRKCPKCGASKIANILYGYPGLTDRLQKELDEGKTVLGGCCITGDDPQWECVECHTRIFKGTSLKKQRTPAGIRAAVFECSICKKAAGTITIAPKGVPLRYEAGPSPHQGDIDDSSKPRLQLDYPGLFSKRLYGAKVIAAARKTIEQHNALPLYKHDPESVPPYCIHCRAWYCSEHWEINVEIIPDGGPYWEEWHWAVCPKKHRRLLFERRR